MFFFSFKPPQNENVNRQHMHDVTDVKMKQKKANKNEQVFRNCITLQFVSGAHIKMYVHKCIVALYEL